MPNPLDALRAKARRDVELASGDVVTVRRISLVDTVLLAEDAPVPVVNQLAKDERTEAPPQAPDVAVQAMRSNRKKQDEIVRSAVVAVNGTAATIKDDDDLAELFTDDDRRRIADAALWMDPEGKA